MKETTEMCEAAIDLALLYANQRPGPSDVPAALAGSSTNGVSNCLGFENPDKGNLKWHCGLHPGILGHLFDDKYQDWRTNEYKTMHFIFHRMSVGSQAKWVTFCLGGKHRSHAWKQVIKWIFEAFGGQVVANHSNQNPFSNSDACVCVCVFVGSC